MWSVHRFLKAMSETLSGWRRWFEARTIIPLIEGVVRLWYHLDLRVYSASARIKAATEGNLDQKSNRYAIFVLYSRAPLPTYTQNLIDAIDRSQINLVIVANATLDPYLKAQLLDRCHLLIERANLGRDFGGYRDAIDVL